MLNTFEQTSVGLKGPYGQHPPPYPGVVRPPYVVVITDPLSPFSSISQAVDPLSKLQSFSRAIDCLSAFQPISQATKSRSYQRLWSLSRGTSVHGASVLATLRANALALCSDQKHPALGKAAHAE